MANGAECKGTSVTQLPFPTLSKKVRLADMFHNFPTLLMSVGKTADDGKISIFTKEGVKVYNKQNSLIMCKCKPSLIGVRNDHRQYHISLIQQQGFNGKDNGNHKNHQKSNTCPTASQQRI